MGRPPQASPADPDTQCENYGEDQCATDDRRRDDHRPVDPLPLTQGRHERRRDARTPRWLTAGSGGERLRRSRSSRCGGRPSRPWRRRCRRACTAARARARHRELSHGRPGAVARRRRVDGARSGRQRLHAVLQRWGRTRPCLPRSATMASSGRRRSRWLEERRKPVEP